MYNNWFSLFSIMMAKDKLKKNNVSTDPPELIAGLILPGVPPIHQILMTNAVVDKAIAAKERDDANVNAVIATQEKANTDEKIATLGAKILIIKGESDRNETENLKRDLAELALIVAPQSEATK